MNRLIFSYFKENKNLYFISPDYKIYRVQGKYKGILENSLETNNLPKILSLIKKLGIFKGKKISVYFNEVKI